MQMPNNLAKPQMINRMIHSGSENLMRPTSICLSNTWPNMSQIIPKKYARDNKTLLQISLENRFVTNKINNRINATHAKVSSGDVCPLLLFNILQQMKNHDSNINLSSKTKVSSRVVSIDYIGTFA